MKKIIVAITLLCSTSIFAQVPNFNIPNFPSTPQSPTQPQEPITNPEVNLAFSLYCAGVPFEQVELTNEIVKMSIAFCGGLIVGIVSMHLIDMAIYEQLIKQENIKPNTKYKKLFCIKDTDDPANVRRNVFIWVNQNQNIAFSTPPLVVITLALAEKYPCK